MWYGCRNFLQLCLFAGSGFSVLGCQGITKSGSANILVLVAGVAGLAATYKLKFKGFKVTVLEGRNCIGGRTFTDKSIGLPVDLGGSWIPRINHPSFVTLGR